MKIFKLKLLVSIFIVAILISSCSLSHTLTKGMVGIAGAVLCGTAGGVAAGLSKNDALGKQYSAGCQQQLMAAVFSDRQVRTVEQDQKLYGDIASVQTPQLRIRNAAISPGMVKGGDKLKLVLDYSVMAPTGTTSVAVKETVAFKTGTTMLPVSERNIERLVGGHEWISEIQIPDGTPSGVYSAVLTARIGNDSDVRELAFTITTGSNSAAVEPVKPSQNNATVKIYATKAFPVNALPGQKIDIATSYQLNLYPTQKTVPVRLSYLLKKEGKVLFQSPEQLRQQGAGGFQTMTTLNVPLQAEPGTYVVETKVQAEKAYDVNETAFAVSAAP